MQDREPTSRRLDDLSYLTDMVTSCFAIEEEIFFRCEATDMVSERSEGNEEGNGYRVGKPPRGTKGVGIVVRMWIKPALLHTLYTKQAMSVFDP